MTRKIVYREIAPCEQGLTGIYRCNHKTLSGIIMNLSHVRPLVSTPVNNTNPLSCRSSTILQRDNEIQKFSACEIYLLPTECPKINRKSVLHLLKYTENIYLSRCSTDLRLLLGHSVYIIIFYTIFLKHFHFIQPYSG